MLPLIRSCSSCQVTPFSYWTQTFSSPPLPIVTSLVESLRWPVVVPLQSTVELDASNMNPLGDAAKEAAAFVVSQGPTPGKGGAALPTSELWKVFSGCP